MSREVSSIQITVYLPYDEVIASYNVFVNGTAIESGVASSDIALASYGQTISVVIDVSVYGYISSAYTIYVTRGDKNGWSPWYTVLIVIAVLVVLALIAYAIYWLYKRSRSRSALDDYQPIPEHA